MVMATNSDWADSVQEAKISHSEISLADLMSLQL